MKHSNGILLFWMFSLLLFTVSSCKKDNEDSPEKKTQEYTFELDVTDDAYTYQTGDSIAALIMGNRLSIPRLSMGSGNHFTGKAITVSRNTDYTYVYPSRLVNFAYSDTVVVLVNTSLQNGTKEGLQTFRMGINKIDTIINYKGTGSVTMHDQLAHATFHFTYQGQPLKQITYVEISAASGVFHGTLNYNLRKRAWETADQNNLIMQNKTGVDGSVELNLIPSSKAQLCFNIKTASGEHYTGKCASTMQIKAGEKYEIDCACEPFEQKAKVGDYFYADGTYSSVFDRSKILAGIVFALTDEMDGNINPTLKESNHGRVVSTTDLSTDLMRWTYSSSYAYDIPSLENYTGVLNTDSLSYLSKLDGSTISIDKDGNIETWATTGALSSFKGKENTAICDTSAIKHQAAYLCHNLSRAGYSHKRWYLPATGELALLYQLYVKGIISAAAKQGFTDFQEIAYWSSDEHNDKQGWAVNFITGMVFCNYKLSNYQVRPCLHF